jgi:hypothetical protein
MALWLVCLGPIAVLTRGDWFGAIIVCLWGVANAVVLGKRAAAKAPRRDQDQR